jgi:hypothetical protein
MANLLSLDPSGLGGGCGFYAPALFAEASFFAFSIVPRMTGANTDGWLTPRERQASENSETSSLGSEADSLV